MKHESNLIWLDCEMTGLDFDRDVILEIACVITDSKLNVIAEGPSLVINQPDRIIDHMGEWCQRQHAKSGLIFDVKQSQITTTEAEEEILEFLKIYCFPNKSPLCGSSIWVDRLFLMKYMPRIHAFTHYRNVDVAAVKELVSRWYVVNLEKDLPKKDLHRALSDIYESVNELKFYRDRFFISPTQ